MTRVLSVSINDVKFWNKRRLVDIKPSKKTKSIQDCVSSSQNGRKIATLCSPSRRESRHFAASVRQFAPNK